MVPPPDDLPLNYAYLAHHLVWVPGNEHLLGPWKREGINEINSPGCMPVTTEEIVTRLICSMRSLGVSNSP